ncbi:MAG: SoxR reducing system RseC family protein [Treponema sp.]|nr:SoxR reducing system RseC family protein [Treponema sp.]
MTERGRIREIREEQILIVPDRDASCFGCMKMECKNAELLNVGNPRGLPLKTGQVVEVNISARSLSWQTLTILLPPLFGFAAGFVLFRRFFGEAGEGAAAFTGVIFLFATAFLIYRFRKKPKPSAGFVITRIIY